MKAPLGWRCVPSARDPPGQFEEIPFPTAGTGTLGDNSVTNPKLADMAQNTIKGRISASTGDPEDLSPAQVSGILPTFSSGAKGLVPASGGDGSKFLSADGSFKVPGAAGITQFEKVHFRGDGSIIWKSANIGSITRKAEGRYRINFINGFGYYTVSGAAISTGDVGRMVCVDPNSGSTGSYVDIAVFSHSGAFVDSDAIWVNLIQ